MIACPVCQHSRTEVVSSPLPKRYRRCLSITCGHRFATIEIPAADDDVVLADVRVRKALAIVKEAIADAEVQTCKNRDRDLQIGSR